MYDYYFKKLSLNKGLYCDILYVLLFVIDPNTKGVNHRHPTLKKGSQKCLSSKWPFTHADNDDDDTVIISRC